MARGYIHEVVDHSHGEYIKHGFHTNSIEGFWSQLKRGILGIYHLVTPKYLAKYCYEFALRYNTRYISDGNRFSQFIIFADKRLRYCELVYP